MPGRSSKELHVFQEIVQALERSPTLGRGLDQGVEILAREVKMERGTIILLRPGTKELRIVSAHGLTDEQKRRGSYQLGEGITGQVVQSGEPVVVPRISKEPQFLDRTGARQGQPEAAFLCVPILEAGRPLGALSADRPPRASAGFVEDLKFLAAVASLLG